jgi:hypothetical protein
MFAEERPVIAQRPAAHRGERAERVVAGEKRHRARPLAAKCVRSVDADRTELFADPAVQCRGCDRVRRLPKRVDVLARRRQEERAFSQTQAMFAAREVLIEISLHDANASALRVIAFVAREEVHVSAETRRRTPVDADLHLCRKRVVIER